MGEIRVQMSCDCLTRPQKQSSLLRERTEGMLALMPLAPERERPLIEPPC